MVFKDDFSEKVEEVQHQLHCIRTASRELRESRRLAKILEVREEWSDQGRVKGERALPRRYLSLGATSSFLLRCVG